MSTWVINPFERFGKYFRGNEERCTLERMRRCRCTLERVKDPKYEAEIVILIQRNGASQYKILWCQTTYHDYNGNVCYVHDVPKPIAHDKLTEDERVNARIIRVSWSTSRFSCDRCGNSTETETHHWAPHKLFSDANDWPTSDLCVECHRVWHRTINRRRVVGKSQDYLEDVERYCDHCKRGAHEVNVYKHYWAPKKLFVDWEEWPASNLCFDCIVKWRSVMYRKRDMIDPEIVAEAKEQCGIEVEVEPEEPMSVLMSWVMVIGEEIAARM